MKSHHILLGVMAEVLCGVSNEQIGKVHILAIAVLPLLNTADIYTPDLIIEGVSKEA
jgi:hypothetical protein